MEAAAELKTTMDLSVDPCEDFYKYSCGGFIKKAKIREDRSQDSAPMEIDDIIRDQVGKGIRTLARGLFRTLYHDYRKY